MTKGWLLWLGVSLCILGLAACAAPASTATPTSAPVAAPTKASPVPTATPTKRPLVKFPLGTTTEATLFLPVWAALAKDFFQEEGLDAERYAISGSAKITAAVASGDIQFAAQSYPEALIATNTGLPIQVVGALNRGMGAQTLLRTEIAQRLAIPKNASVGDKLYALKGLTISATSKGGYSDNIFRAFLARYGIDPDRDITITYIAKDADALAAFERGVTDAMTMAPPATTVALEKGVGVLLINWRGGEVPEVYDSLYQVFTVNREWASKNRDLAEAALRAIWRGFDLVWEKRDEARKTLKNYKQFQEITEASFNEAFDIEFDILLRQPWVPMEMMQKSIDLFNSYSPQDQKVSLRAEQFYDPSYAEAAKKQLGF
ncbi:MAG: ABC transporter substrate-binding protein [Chloroflexi bacterium]|nr:ABC transporter substrate-binding protein [Chloroflexota bacterium]